MSETPVILSESVRVPMRDGTELSVHVHRPVGDGPFPAIISYTPYGKGIVSHGPPSTMVQHGYAELVFDIRGTGDSAGWNDSIYSPAERQDGYDMIEWVARQPWCSGKVGMWGISFGGVVSLQMAMAAPPHLAAIIVRSGTDDPYMEWTSPGGSPRPYIYQNYAPIMTARNCSPPSFDEWGERWQDVWRERLDKNVPWGISFLRNLADGPFWRERSLRGNYDKVKCPVFVVGGWADWYPTPLLRVFENLAVPKRALIGPWSHQWPGQGIPGPRIDWEREALKWWDYWLKGMDTGVMDEPPVTLFVRDYDTPATIREQDSGRFRCEQEWPIARTDPRTFYLADAGALSLTPPGEADDAAGADKLVHDPRVGACAGVHGGGPLNINWLRPLDQRPDELDSLSYTGPVLTDSVEVVGRPSVTLHACSSARIVLFAVKLCDVAPDGTSAVVTAGYLNTAHRESHSHPSYVEPGTPYAITIQLLACAYRFAPGHRIRLDISHADFMNVWPTPEHGVTTIFRLADRASALILPVVPDRESPLPEPDLHVPPPRPLAELTPPFFSVGRDIVHDTATCAYNNPDLANEAAFTVSARDPATAILQARGDHTCTCDGRKIEARAICLTESDATVFRHTVALVITIDGEDFFRKDWSETVPRQFF